jgi:hypothetical protein
MSAKDGKKKAAAAAKRKEEKAEEDPAVLHEQSLEDAYAEPTNFLEIEVHDPQNHGASGRACLYCLPVHACSRCVCIACIGHVWHPLSIVHVGPILFRHALLEPWPEPSGALDVMATRWGHARFHVTRGHAIARHTAQALQWDGGTHTHTPRSKHNVTHTECART